MLKESGEFDRLLPELLLAMKIVPLSKAQIGVRQGGVDISAIGKSPDGRDCIYLFVLKRGSLGRSDWSSGKNAIRPSLEEIKDIYLTNHVLPEHKDLLKLIVVSSTGDLKQDTRPNWDGYVKQNTIPGEVEYDFWNGDRISILIEKFLFNEHLLSDEAKSDLRKALSLVGETEDDLTHFHKLLRRLLLDNPLKEKGAIKALRTVNLAINILLSWAESENNLANALKATERSLLWGWEAIRKNSLQNRSKVLESYSKLTVTYINFSQTYFNKIQKYCYVRDALSIYSSENALVTESIYQQIGILALIGLLQFDLKDCAPDYASEENAKIVAHTLASLIANNPSSGSPCYDGHAIEISLALLLFTLVGYTGAAESWLRELVSRVTYAFGTGRLFPIGNDSFDDLVELNTHNIEKKRKKLMEVSTLIPTLAQWLAVFGLHDSYVFLLSYKPSFSDTCLQLWYPDETTEEHLYMGPAQYKSGTTEAPIDLPDNIEEFEKRVAELVHTKYYIDISSMSFSSSGIPILDLIASRHFRTPVHPIYWQRFLADKYEQNKQSGLTGSA